MKLWRANIPGREVANSASTVGLPGVVHSMRQELRCERIAVTVINPGNLWTPEGLSHVEAIGAPSTDAIPLADLLTIIDCVLSLSRSSGIKEIDGPAMSGKGPCDHGAVKPFSSPAYQFPVPWSPP